MTREKYKRSICQKVYDQKPVYDAFIPKRQSLVKPIFQISLWREKSIWDSICDSYFIAFVPRNQYRPPLQNFYAWKPVSFVIISKRLCQETSISCRYFKAFVPRDHYGNWYFLGFVIRGLDIFKFFLTGGQCVGHPCLLLNFRHEKSHLLPIF